MGAFWVDLTTEIHGVTIKYTFQIAEHLPSAKYMVQ